MWMDSHPFPPQTKPCTGMMFVDGENLTIRWQQELAGQEKPSYVSHEKDVYVWTQYLAARNQNYVNIIRKHYYTSAIGDSKRLDAIFDELKSHGIEAPYVFKRTKERPSKRVDITLSVDMLSHAYQRNYDVAILIAGDADYVPLVSAVKRAGLRVFLWFLEKGLNPALRREVDHYFNISQMLYGPSPQGSFDWL
jgi:uncharacterized LabA/DUF88 family protein